MIITGLLLPYAWLALYQHPAGDDFHFAVPTAQWGPLTTVMGLYESWSARYSSAFFWAVNPLSWHSLWGYRAFTFLLMGLMVSSFWFYLSQLFEITTSKLLLLALFCLTAFLGYAQTLPEAIFNSGGYVPYQTGGAFFLILHASFLWALRKEIYQNYRLKNLIFWILQAGLIFLVIGFNEIFMALELGFWAALFAGRLAVNRTFSLPYFMFLLAALAGTLVVLFSPATFYRMEASGSFGRSAIWVLSSSLLAWLRFTGGFFISPGLLLLFIFLSLLPVKSSPFAFTRRHFFISLPVSLLVLLFCFFPSYKGEGEVQDHTLNLFQFLAICLIIWNIFVAKVGGIQPFAGIRFGNMPVSFFKWIFFLGIIFWMNPNQITATEDLLSGEARAYERERSARMEAMKQAQGDSVWVEPYRHFPASFLSSELGQGPGQWYDNLYARYYGKRFVHLREGKPQNSLPGK